jgi:hypothetical protein
MTRLHSVPAATTGCVRSKHSIVHHYDRIEHLSYFRSPITFATQMRTKNKKNATMPAGLQFFIFGPHLRGENTNFRGMCHKKTLISL